MPVTVQAITLAALIGAAIPANAQPIHRYGDTLVDDIVARHRNLVFVEIAATAKDGSPIVIRRGHAALATESVPLKNSMGEPIGTISVRFSRTHHAPLTVIADEAARRIYVAGNLIEADPFVQGAHRSALAQRIVDRMMADNPDLVTLGMHIGTTGARNFILASNFGRIGKPGDKDDARVIDDGAVLTEPTNGDMRLAVSLPMLDQHGRIIGALSASFRVGPGGFDAVGARATAVRNAIARQIPSLAAVLR